MKVNTEYIIKFDTSDGVETVVHTNLHKWRHDIRECKNNGIPIIYGYRRKNKKKEIRENEYI